MADAAIVEIAEYHNDVVSSLRLYFGRILSASGNDFRSQELVASRLRDRLEETDQRSVFFILARLEAAFRVDYEFRCRKKMKDDLSRAFREMWKFRRERVSLDEDIFEAWKEHSSGSGKLISELRGAFKFRHWLAHGSYWVPKFRKYDFTFVYSLADDILSGFPLQRFD